MTDQFIYVSVLLSIVIALALTQLLEGIATLLRVRVTRFSFVYMGWVGVLLFACVDLGLLFGACVKVKLVTNLCFVPLGTGHGALRSLPTDRAGSTRWRQRRPRGV